MKRNSFYLLCVCVIAMTTACNDMDLFPHDQLGAGTFWKTEGDIQMGVAGVYSTLKGEGMDYRRYRVDNLTDNSWQWTNGGSSGIIQRGSIEPTTGGTISAMYNTDYRGVAACNNFLKNFPAAKVNAKITEAKANQYEAEIRFLRALFYFDLVYFYGDVPLYKEAIETVEASKVKQSSASEIYAFIKEDIDFAINHLPATAYGSGHAVKGSALALKARIALFQSDWNTVESVTKEIISSGTYKLADSYWSIFIKREGQKNNPEILFSVTYLNPDIRHNAETEYYIQCEIEPMENLMKCYEPQDVRLKEWFVNVGLNQTTFENPFGEIATVQQGSQTGWITLKHMDKYKKETYSYSNYDFRTDNDIILLRYADVYLMYIEAMVEKGGGNTTDVLALQAMNEIRTRAGLDPVTSVSRDLLRLERRRELVFEGLRHFDLVRWRTAKEVMNGLDTPMGPCIFKDHYYTWPFPQSEMDINPQLDQKPGYL